MSETGAGTISLPSKPQRDEAVSSPISHNSDVVDLHMNTSGRLQAASQRQDVEFSKSDAVWEDESLVGADMSDCAAGRTQEGLNDALLGKQESVIIGEEDIDGAKFYAVAGIPSLLAEEKLEPGSVLAWKEKLKGLVDINGNGIKQDTADKTARKKKRGPDSVPAMHSRSPKRARNNDGEDEQDLQPSSALVEPDIFVVEKLVLHRELESQGNDSVEYLVQWEGDWPGDQKFTWEPEDHIIDVSLVGSYWRGVISALQPYQECQSV